MHVKVLDKEGVVQGNWTEIRDVYILDIDGAEVQHHSDYTVDDDTAVVYACMDSVSQVITWKDNDEQ